MAFAVRLSNLKVVRQLTNPFFVVILNLPTDRQTEEPPYYSVILGLDPGIQTETKTKRLSPLS